MVTVHVLANALSLDHSASCTAASHARQHTHAQIVSSPFACLQGTDDLEEAMSERLQELPPPLGRHNSTPRQGQGEFSFPQDMDTEAVGPSQVSCKSRIHAALGMPSATRLLPAGPQCKLNAQLAAAACAAHQSTCCSITRGFLCLYLHAMPMLCFIQWFPCILRKRLFHKAVLTHRASVLGLTYGVMMSQTQLTDSVRSTYCLTAIWTDCSLQQS